MKYYDPEYDRIVDESVPKKQYEWFAAQRWFHKTYVEPGILFFLPLQFSPKIVRDLH